LDKKRNRWIKENHLILATACVNALHLYEDTTQASTDLLHITITIRPDHCTSPSKHFELLDANVISFTEARRIRTEFGDHWEQCVRLFESGCRELGNMAAIAIDLVPLPVYFFQLRLENIHGLPLSPDWKTSLRKTIRDG
jgi:hypothetical protein